MRFAQLFRRSAFARFDPQVPLVFAKGAHPNPLNESLPLRGVHPAPLFGRKHEPPTRWHGQSVDFVTFKTLDGDFGQPEFALANDRVHRQRILRHLIDRVGSHSSTPMAQSLPGLARVPADLRVPGRILDSCEGGFLVGIGPVRALLPQTEIPAAASFNYADILDKRAYLFTVKTVEAVACSRSRHAVNNDIFATTDGDDRKKPYESHAREQGFRVVLTLRK